MTHTRLTHTDVRTRLGRIARERAAANRATKRSRARIAPAACVHHQHDEGRG